MNYKMMGRFIAQILLIETVFLIPALCISMGYGEYSVAAAFLQTMLVSAAVGSGLHLLCGKSKRLFGIQEGFLSVGFGWIALSLVGCLPFLFSGAIPKFIDAFFETVSGFTTTGASILSDVESLPKGLLYWRSFSHWVGGMGVLVFLLAVSPSGKGGGFTMHLLRAESPGPDVGKLVPKMRQTAMILYVIYIVLTVINVVFLLAGGMAALDAVCIAFGTAGTGGFGIRNDSFASYSPYIVNVTTVFMFLFGINFSCYYLLLLRQFKAVLKDEEVRLYILIAVAAAVLIGINIYDKADALYDTTGKAAMHAAFQVSSVMTTTGFSTVDFNLWPAFSKGILLVLMVIGACAGSTGGGIKVARVLLIFKSLRRNIRQTLNPKKVQVIRNNGGAMDEQVVANTNAYLAAYVIIVILSFLVVSLDKFSVETNLSAVLACFNNIGPGMDAVGPMANYASYNAVSKSILIVDMLAGRLEIFPILVLLSRSAWSRR